MGWQYCTYYSAGASAIHHIGAKFYNRKGFGAETLNRALLRRSIVLDLAVTLESPPKEGPDAMAA